MNLQALVIFGAIPVAALATGVWARGEARKDLARRVQLTRRAIVLVVVGIILARGIWYVGPTNPESPAMIFTYLISWFGGGGMILFGAALWIGAGMGKAD
jgi:hypothetical protein